MYFTLCSPSQHELLSYGVNPTVENVTIIREVLETVDWTPQAIQDLESSLLNGDLIGLCASDRMVRMALLYL